MLHILITDTVTKEELLSQNIRNISSVITTDDKNTGVIEIGEFSGIQIIATICAFEKIAEDHYKRNPTLRLIIKTIREDIMKELDKQESEESPFDAILRGFMSEDKQ